MIINTIKNLKKIHIPVEIKRHYFSIFIQSTIIIVLLLITNNYLIIENKYIVIDSTYTLIKTLIVILYFIFSIMNLNNVIKLDKKDSELKLQEFYNEKMKTFIDEIYMMKFDFSNTISKITDLINLEKWHELELYYSELLANSKYINSTQEIINIKICSPAILGLISNKAGLASSKNLFFYIEVNDEIDNIQSGEYLLCDILGCLLDNAIEAALESDLKHLKMIVERINGNVSFRIENSYKQKPDINTIFIKGVSTKGQGRGNGLWFIKQRIDREENLILNTYIENNYIIQEFIIKEENEFNILNVLKLPGLKT